MTMNIKNPEANRLARELADLTGESVTEAITVAVRERLERVAKERHREEQIQLLLKLGRECAEHMNEPFLSTDHADLLYDDLGLPR